MKVKGLYGLTRFLVQHRWTCSRISWLSGHGCFFIILSVNIKFFEWAALDFHVIRIDVFCMKQSYVLNFVLCRAALIVVPSFLLPLNLYTIYQHGWHILYSHTLFYVSTCVTLRVLYIVNWWMLWIFVYDYVWRIGSQQAYADFFYSSLLETKACSSIIW